MKNKYSRRRFLKHSISASMAIAGSGMVYSQIAGSESNSIQTKNPYDPKGLPTAVLGKTGVTIPRIAIGLGSRFLNIETLDEALEMCNYALDNGLYYWDTAHDYVNTSSGAISEERLGHILKSRRNEIFLSTKISARDPETAKQQVEESLKRLQTDHLDMMKIHAVESVEEANNICKTGGVLDLFSKLKDQGVTRFIGFSGHGNAAALRAMLDTGRFDSMLFAMNHYTTGQDRQGNLIPAARQRGMGVMLMKTVRPKETIKEINPEDLVRYALSLEGPSGIAVGMDSKKVVDSNLNILRNFKPMGQEEMKRLAMTLAPYFRHENLEWMQAGYRDGFKG